MPSVFMGDDSAPEFEYVAGAIYRHRSHETHRVYHYLCVRNDFNPNTRSKFSFICIDNYSSSEPKIPAMTMVDCLKPIETRRGSRPSNPLEAAGNLTLVARMSLISWE